MAEQNTQSLPTLSARCQTEGPQDDKASKHGSGASGSGQPLLASAGHRGPGADAPPLRRPDDPPGHLFGNGENVFFRPRGDDEGVDHPARRPAPRQHWQLEDSPVPVTDAMKPPELTREVRLLRHNLELDRNHSQTLHEAALNHAQKLDIHTDFLKQLSDHVMRMEANLMAADVQVGAKNMEFEKVHATDQAIMTEMWKQCTQLVENLETNDAQVRKLIEGVDQRALLVKQHLAELTKQCMDLHTTTSLNTAAVRSGVNSCGPGHHQEGRRHGALRLLQGLPRALRVEHRGPQEGVRGAVDRPGAGYPQGPAGSRCRLGGECWLRPISATRAPGKSGPARRIARSMGELAEQQRRRSPRWTDHP